MTRQASHTALTAAAARATHLLVDRAPLVLADTLALRLLGDQAEELVAYHRLHGDHPVLSTARAMVVCRSRYVEDRVAAAGADQYVVLGAGLDSFACRQPEGQRLRVYEVDHPASQESKRDRLRRAGIELRATQVPVDFERDDLTRELVRAGFDPERKALVSWLGVTMYLSPGAIAQTLDAVGGWAVGTELIVEYLLDPEHRDPVGQSYVDQVAPVAAGHGEPWLSSFAPREMTALLATAGFAETRQVSQRDMIPAELWQRTDSLRPVELSYLAHATR